MEPLPLRDIHLPPPVSWWPPAPGWWLLALLVVGVGVWLFFRWRQLRLRRRGLRALAQIERRFARERDERALVQAVSTLLRRVCLTYLPRARVASVTGAKWRAVVTGLAQRPDAFSDAVMEQLMRAPYDPAVAVEPVAVIAQTRRWLRALPPLHKTPPC